MCAASPRTLYLEFLLTRFCWGFKPPPPFATRPRNSLLPCSRGMHLGMTVPPTPAELGWDTPFRSELASLPNLKSGISTPQTKTRQRWPRTWGTSFRCGLLSQRAHCLLPHQGVFQGGQDVGVGCLAVVGGGFFRVLNAGICPGQLEHDVG